MAYDPTGQNFDLVKSGLSDAISGTLKFNGRTRRTDLAVYLIVSGVVSFILFMILCGMLPFETARISQVVIRSVLYIPLPALFVRRLHDQNRNGWFALIALAAIAVQTWQNITWETATDPSEIYNPLNPFRLVVGVLSLASIIFALCPGTVGENRYGLDPRQVT